MRCHSFADLCVLGWPWAALVRPRCGCSAMQSTTINHAKTSIQSLPQPETSTKLSSNVKVVQNAEKFLPEKANISQLEIIICAVLFYCLFLIVSYTDLGYACYH